MGNLIRASSFASVLFPLFFFLFLGSCARAPLVQPEDALRLSSDRPKVLMGAERVELAKAIQDQVAFLKTSKRISDLRFGPRRVSREDYLLAMDSLAKEIEARPPEEFSQWLADRFDFYEVYGRTKWGEVLITSYFEPVIMGSRTRTAKHDHPVYGLPKDLVEVRLKDFGLPLANDPKQLRGRLIGSELGDGSRVEPYFSRADIDIGKKLQGQHNEICWVDPIDSFFMQIQGSGVIRFPDGEEIRVGYAGQNGHAYEPIGKFLRSVIPIEEMTMQKIEAHLRGLAPKERDELLAKNPSYVFFQKNKQNALTYLGVPATAERTIATDAKFFPKGAIAILSYQVPEFGATHENPTAWKSTTQLVLDQDVGGAIRGPDRVDFFWGRGDEAKRSAGLIKQMGSLVYLAPKEAWINELRGRVHEN